MNAFIPSKFLRLLQGRTKPFSFLKSISLLFLFLFSTFTIRLYGQAADLDQIRNGSTAFTTTTPTADWVNGNAGPQNAHYAEGWSIPYRMVVTGLTTGTHTLIIEWDTKHSGGHAIDFVTRYDFLDNPAGSHLGTFGHVPEVINPLLGLSGTFSAPSTRDFPAPGSTGSSVAGQPTTTFNGLAGNTYMTIYNGSIAAGGMTYDFEQPPSDANATSSTRLRIVFTANASTVVFAWAGHIGTQQTWGQGQGATGVSGSPYHTRLISLDGSGGNQDRSLKASAVIIPPTCTIDGPRTLCPETSSLTYTSTADIVNGAVTYQWSLINNTANAMISGSSTGSSITVTPNPATGDFTAGGSFNVKLVVTRNGATHTCYLGSDVSPGDNVTVDNVQVTASANPATIAITSATHNSSLTASASLNGVTNNSLFNFAWTVDAPYTLDGSNVKLAVAPFTIVGTLTNTTTDNATFTASTGGITVVFRVTATEKTAPGCSNSNTVTVVVSGGPSCPDISGPNPICINTTNTYTAAGSIPDNTTYTWTANNGATIVGGEPASHGTSVSVLAGTQDFTLNLQMTFANTGLAPINCPYNVVVNNVNPGEIAGSQTLCTPFDPAAFTSTTDGTGDGIITYQWQSSTTSAVAGFSDISGATSATYDAPAVSVKTWYRRTATSTLNGIACSDNSNVIAVTPNDINPGSIDNAQTICTNADPSVLNNVTSASSNAGGTITYQWQSNTSGCDAAFTDIAGATDATYDPPALTQNTYYRRVATSTLNGVACSANSNCVGITVNNCAHIFPTQTTCCNYLGGNVSSFQLQNVCYTVTSGKVSNAIPGVFFYYADFTTAGGNLTILVHQVNNNANFNLFSPQNTSNVRLFINNCISVTPTSVSISGGDATIVLNNAAAGKYVVSVKYDTKSILGSGPAGSKPDVIYTFSTSVNGTQVGASIGSVTAKADCTDNTPAPSGDCPAPAVTIAGGAIAEDMVSGIAVSAYPNPFTDKVKFIISSPVSGQAQLDVMNMLGQKVATVYNGYIQANKGQVVEYKVPLSARANLLYILRIGDKKVTGKLLRNE